MNKTKIEWVRNPDGSQGYSWNPITGCLKRCPYCYSWKLAKGRLRSRYLANNILPTHDEPNHEAHHSDPFYPRFWPEKIGNVRNFLFASQYRRYTNPVGVFVCDMSDLFGIGVPKAWTKDVMQVIRDGAAHSSHRFYLLTKQPQNLLNFSPFPSNCWVGVTVTRQEFLSDALRGLLSIDAKVKYLSCEPLLGLLNVSFYKGEIQWVIIGAQTNPTILPRIEWVREIVEAADKASIPVFLKNNLLELVNYQSPETAFAFNKEGYYRQELPL